MVSVPWVLCGLAAIGWIGVHVQFRAALAQAQIEVEVEVEGEVGARDAGEVDLAPPSGPTTTEPATAKPTTPEPVATSAPDTATADRRLFVDPGSSGASWSALGAVEGLLTFRGNPTRTYHGSGPMPQNPKIRWQRFIGCSNSSVGGEDKQWCGTGWTGQPAVFPRPGRDGAGFWVGVGGFDRQVSFFDPDDGSDAFPGVATEDIIKGSITVDPDGYPLIYTGSRDNYFHIAAIDGDQPRELWRLSADDDQPTLWNNDWDSSALVIDGYLIVGGENSRFYVVELNRYYEATGRVAVDPEVVVSAAGWDQELLDAVGVEVSIENSVAMSGTVVYFTNSGGLVQGWDLAGLDRGRSPERVFRFWTGDDTDASIVIDGDGMLYVASEFERGNQRSRDLGQVFKLDPSNPDDPVVWSRSVTDRLDGGVWATPAIHRDVLIVPTDGGTVFGLDVASGRERWRLELPGPLWSSPVVIDDVYLQGDCAGGLHGFDVSNTIRQPRPLWTVALRGCIESTPAVWDGVIYVGTRSGDFYAVGD